MTAPRVQHEEFRECESCAAKPGSPTLCASCLHNRKLVADLRAEKAALIEKYCGQAASEAAADNRRAFVRLEIALAAERTAREKAEADREAVHINGEPRCEELTARIHKMDVELVDLRRKVPRRPFDVGCADALADEVAVLVRREIIGSRSPAADALLDYRSPPSSPRADRLAQLEAERDESRALRAAPPVPAGTAACAGFDWHFKTADALAVAQKRIDVLIRDMRRWLVGVGVGKMKAGGVEKWFCRECERGPNGEHQAHCDFDNLTAILDAAALSSPAVTPPVCPECGTAATCRACKQDKRRAAVTTGEENKTLSGKG